MFQKRYIESALKIVSVYGISMSKVFDTIFMIIFARYLKQKKKKKNGNTTKLCFFCKKGEVIVYCCECKDFFTGLFFYLKLNSVRYFDEVKKSLIQYIPTFNK